MLISKCNQYVIEPRLHFVSLSASQPVQYSHLLRENFGVIFALLAKANKFMAQKSVS